MGLGDRADDREAEPAAAAAGGVGGAVAPDEAVEDLVARSPGGIPGPSSATSSTASSPSASSRRRSSMLEPGGVWRTAFSSRLSDEAVELVGVALDRDGPAVVDAQRGGSSASGLDLGQRGARRPRPGRTSVRRRAPPGVGAGEQQQVGDQPAHPPRGAAAPSRPSRGRRSARRRRARPGAARGWPARWSAACAARARRRRRTRAGARMRARARRAPRRGPRASASRVAASSPISSSVGGLGHPLRGVARGRRSRARRRSARRSAASRGRRRRGRRAAPAGCRRARPRRGRARGGRSSRRRSSSAARVLDEGGQVAAAVGDRLRRDAKSPDVVDARLRRPEVGAAVWRRASWRPGWSTTRIDGAVGHREVVGDRDLDDGPAWRVDDPHLGRRATPAALRSSSSKSSRIAVADEAAEHDREDDQDQQRQPGGGEREPPAHRPAGRAQRPQPRACAIARSRAAIGYSLST